MRSRLRLDTLKYVKHETDVWLDLTTLLIPGQNDSDKELNEMTHWVVEMQSEGAAPTTIFTASQGLLLMIPNW